MSTISTSRVQQRTFIRRSRRRVVLAVGRNLPVRQHWRSPCVPRRERGIKSRLRRVDWAGECAGLDLPTARPVCMLDAGLLREGVEDKGGGWPKKRMRKTGQGRKERDQLSKRHRPRGKNTSHRDVVDACRKAKRAQDGHVTNHVLASGMHILSLTVNILYYTTSIMYLQDIIIRVVALL